ncbi:MAG: hypothetical protein BMS9Abin29_1441 [Gemmatimonadota bacterium]|nr:MAG: hypothetical protein BMS9Abin29_1441 [Gemmatimonadota bacterium]
MKPERTQSPLSLRASRFVEAAEEDLSPLAGTHIFEAARRDRLAKLGIADQTYVDWLRRLLPHMLEAYAAEPSPRILDFGCGTGELTVLMNALGYRAYGIDVHRRHLALAQLLAEENDLPGGTFVRTGGPGLPFADDSFDLINLHVVVEHLSNPVLDIILPELARVCRGAVFITVPNRLQLVDDHTGLRFVPWMPRPVAEAYVRLRGSRYVYGISRDGSWDVWYRSFTQIRRLFERAGFRLEVPPDAVIFPPADSPAQRPLSTYHEVSPSRLKRLVWRGIGAGIGWTTPRDAPSQALYPYLNLVFVPGRAR